MTHMEQTVREISDTFVSEAKASPRMLEDLAAMERYMAESYDGRTFVELIQNADDAKSGRIAIRLVGSTLVVANDGRPFDEADVLAISRSGASNKQRGNTIGYRGVGFKSATSISNEIVVRSGGACFTFSKRVCARRLQTSVNHVPTVRIPFLFDESGLPHDSAREIEQLECEGFTTFFVFLNANADKTVLELSDFNAGWLLFLRSIHEVDVRCGSLSRCVTLTRDRLSETDSLLRVDNSGACWLVTASNEAALAFRYEEGRGVIPCDTEDAVFHCFMPTLDKTGFPFKVNAGFSTDPSRKHVIADAITSNAMALVQSLLVETIVNAARNCRTDLYPILTLLGVRTTLSSLSSGFESGVLEGLRGKSWVPVSRGVLVRPSSVRILPKWLDADECEALSLMEELDADSIPNRSFLEAAPKVEPLLFKLGAVELPAINLAFTLEDSNTVSNLPIPMLAKIFAHLFRTTGTKDDIFSRSYIPLEEGSEQIRTLTPKSKISPDFLSGIKAILSNDELNTLSLLYGAFAANVSPDGQEHLGNGRGKSAAGRQPEAPVLNRWKTPVQNCIAAETQAGNAAKKAGPKCAEYDVVSTDSNGATSYIAAKSVGSIGDSFRMSEAEYEAARRYGDHYKIYLFSMGVSEIECSVIVNPAYEAKTAKVVKEWEWIIEDYVAAEAGHGDCDAPIEATDTEAPFDKDFDNMDGKQFERFCARLLIRNGYQDVGLTKDSGDQGIDVIAYRDGIKYGIQCKCYGSDVGNDAVQEAYAGKSFYGCNVAIVMTNRRFTPSAARLAESNNVILWGREMVMRMVDTAM